MTDSCNTSAHKIASHLVLKNILDLVEQRRSKHETST